MYAKLTIIVNFMTIFVNFIAIKLTNITAQPLRRMIEDRHNMGGLESMDSMDMPLTPASFAGLDHKVVRMLMFNSMMINSMDVCWVFLVRFPNSLASKRELGNLTRCWTTRW